MVFIGDDRRIVELNAAAARLVGREVSEVLGSRLDDFLHADELDETRDFERRLRSGEEEGAPRYKRFVHRDGSVVHVRVTVITLRDDDEPVQVAGFLEDVTALRGALERVHEEQDRLALTLEASATATWDLDMVTGAYTVSNNLSEICGIDALQGDLTFAEFLDRVHPDDLPRFLEPADPASGADRFLIDFRLRGDDGSYRWYQSRGQVTFEDDVAVTLRGAIVDITASRAREERARRQDQRYRRTIDAASDAYVAADGDGRIVGWNPAAECMFGWSRPQALGGVDVHRLFAPGTDRSVLARAGGRVTVVARHRNGDEFPVEVSVISRSADTDENVRHEAFLRDVTDRVEREHELEHHALVDTLTGLPNRTLLLDRLRGALARRVRADSVLGVFFIDIDGFKMVNDSLGHAAGDELLTRIADRMSSSLRSTDTLARLGGDEFVVLSEDLDDSDHALELADRLLASFDDPIEAGGRRHHVSVSIGVRVVNSGEGSGEDIIRDADAAMYRAKTGGSGRYEIFDEAIRSAVLARLELDTDLHRAVDEDEFFVTYQPVIAVADERVIGLEALLRWDHPTRGILLPEAFIASAEANGLIQAIGLDVLARACKQLAAWHASGWTDLCMAVNLSGSQLNQPEFPDQVASILAANGLPSGYLALEITESMLLAESDRTAAATLARLHELGVTVAADDFGTGYSSLLYLRQFPIDTLKLDRAFVAGIATNATDRAIVGSTIDLAHSLNMLAIAEGVETREQLLALGELGCDFAQGFYWSPPLPAEDLTALFENRGARERAATDGA
jgi:diguanylate cyclase (GGDEF)-like protein/PAS domain S-box-containing protein